MADSRNDDLIPAKQAMLCWNPGTDQVVVVPWPDTAGRSSGHLSTGLSCYEAFRKAGPTAMRAGIFVEAMHLIVRDRCEPLAVHRALLRIPEYVDCCASDMPGMPEAELSRRRAG